MSALGDETGLARAAAAGDGDAFAALYDAYESRIFNFCHRLVGSPEDAADATQDAFLKVLQRLPKLEDRELNFGAYLFTAARNASYDVIGRRKRAEPVDEIPEHGARPVTGDEGAGIYVDPERAALLGSLQESVKAASARLPERQREVLALRELEELSYDDIAAVLEMNRNSVAQLISRARIKLRDELRGSALASVATSSPECERALPLIAMRQDGQLKDAGDREWLGAHLAGCDTCKVSVDAMEEAGLSYRAWLPIVPLAWLREATVAKAAELTGSDWSDVIAAGRRAGDGAVSALAAEPATEAAEAAEAAKAAAATDDGGRRRRALAGVAGVVLLLILFGALVAGLEEGEGPEAVDPAKAAESVPTKTEEASPPARTAVRKRRPAGDAGAGTRSGSPPATTTGSGTTPPSPARRSPASPRRRSGSGITTTGGGGNTGVGRSRPPLTGTTTTTTPTPTATQPPPPSTTPPPTTTTPPPTSTPPPPTRTTPPPTSTTPPRCSPTDPTCQPIP